MSSHEKTKYNKETGQFCYPILIKKSMLPISNLKKNDWICQKVKNSAVLTFKLSVATADVIAALLLIAVKVSIRKIQSKNSF